MTRREPPRASQWAGSGSPSSKPPLRIRLVDSDPPLGTGSIVIPSISRTPVAPKSPTVRIASRVPTGIGSRRATRTHSPSSIPRSQGPSDSRDCSRSSSPKKSMMRLGSSPSRSPSWIPSTRTQSPKIIASTSRPSIANARLARAGRPGRSFSNRMQCGPTGPPSAIAASRRLYQRSGTPSPSVSVSKSSSAGGPSGPSLSSWARIAARLDDGPARATSRVERIGIRKRSRIGSARRVAVVMPGIGLPRSVLESVRVPDCAPPSEHDSITSRPFHGSTRTRPEDFDRAQAEMGPTWVTVDPSPSEADFGATTEPVNEPSMRPVRDAPRRHQSARPPRGRSKSQETSLSEHNDINEHYQTFDHRVLRLGLIRVFGPREQHVERDESGSVEGLEIGDGDQFDGTIRKRRRVRCRCFLEEMAGDVPVRPIANDQDLARAGPRTGKR